MWFRCRDLMPRTIPISTNACCSCRRHRRLIEYLIFHNSTPESLASECRARSYFETEFAFSFTDCAHFTNSRRNQVCLEKACVGNGFSWTWTWSNFRSIPCNVSDLWRRTFYIRRTEVTLPRPLHSRHVLEVVGSPSHRTDIASNLLIRRANCNWNFTPRTSIQIAEHFVQWRQSAKILKILVVIGWPIDVWLVGQVGIAKSCKMCSESDGIPAEILNVDSKVNAGRFRNNLFILADRPSIIACVRMRNRSHFKI